MQQQALAAVVAWMKLERAMHRFEADLRKRHGITSLQLAVLGILAERPTVALAALRKALVMHPATLGQAIDDLRIAGHCTVRTNPDDRRARVVAITPQGLELVQQAPLAGPARLRQVRADPARLDEVTVALEEAVELFGLAPYADKPRS